MATTLPVPITFRLPPGWRQAPPDQVGDGGAAFLAVHPIPHQRFSANIAISGEARTDDVPLVAIADAAVDRLRQAVGEVSVAHCTEIGTTERPGLVQVVRFTASDGDGTYRRLMQAEVILRMVDADDPARCAVLELVLTAAAGQFESVVGDFEEFVRTVEPTASPAE